MGKPHTQWRRVFTHDERLDAYNIQLTREFAKRVTSKADKSPILAEVVYDFVLALRAVGITASLPFTVVSQMNKFVDAYMRATPEPVGKKIAGAITARLVREVGIEDSDLRSRIAAKCLEIGTSAHYLRTNFSPYSVDDIWNMYRNEKGFQIALTESQRIGFVATYNAYESFLVRCLAIALGRPSLRKGSDDKFQQSFHSAFGTAACDFCWEDAEIQLFRAARHAFAHAGGRETKELKRLDHPFTVTTGTIQIAPGHLQYAINLVEQKSEHLVAEALSHPEFGKGASIRRA
jgi:hypothetical protein